MSIRIRLFIMLLLLIILPYFLFVIFIYENSKSSIEERDLARSREELNESRVDLEQYAEEMVRLPYSLFNMPEVQQILENGMLAETTEHVRAFENSVETYATTRPDIRQMRFYFQQDQQSLTVYQSNVSAPKPAPDYLERSPFKEMNESKEAYMLETPHELVNEDKVAIVPESDNTVVLPIHHRITDVLSGKFLGFLTTDIEVSSFSRLLEAVTREAGTQVLLVNGNEEIVYSENLKQIGNNMDESQLTAEGENIVLREELGEPLADWQLIKVTSKDELFRDARETAWTNIVLGIGVVLLGTILVLVISRVFTKPIITLSEKVRSIEGGQMNVQLKTERNDEIGHLAAHMQEMLNRIDSHIAREYKLELEARESQLRMLKSQVNPHFLFNALQSIGAVALRSDDREVYKLLVSLSKMMRYALQADQLVPVREELGYIDSYIMLQKERFGADLPITIQVERSIQENRIPSMLLQPLVENYFKHSYEAMRDKSSFILKGMEKDGLLVFHAASYGTSVSDEKIRLLQEGDTGGTGLQNIAERLHLHHGDKAVFQLDNLDGKGFGITICIPVEEQGGQKHEGVTRG
ncbi:cache domain-containing sensor histidine kinase [Terribacillus saccharophilus]|uniref:cache domain-containing sensor histidine kinase n=1 Tax=Terribacillus saccharophilus TaxID=361277 RepID=UPI002989F830|nr:histidine kinase [Terribacillus saccharophilus]MCM3225690.1 histidine kinase [Terribacillus saccharophilus]